MTHHISGMVQGDSWLWKPAAGLYFQLQTMGKF